MLKLLIDGTYGCENELYLSPGCSRRLHRWVMFWQIPGHVAHEPFKVLAAQSAPELLLGCHVSCRQVAVLRPALIDILCILIHPHLSHPLQVLNAKRINTELTFHRQLPLGMYISFLYAIGNGPAMRMTAMGALFPLVAVFVPSKHMKVHSESLKRNWLGPSRL